MAGLPWSSPGCVEAARGLADSDGRLPVPRSLSEPPHLLCGGRKPLQELPGAGAAPRLPGAVWLPGRGSGIQERAEDTRRCRSSGGEAQAPADAGPHVGNLPRDRMRVLARQPACSRWWQQPA